MQQIQANFSSLLFYSTSQFITSPHLVDVHLTIHIQSCLHLYHRTSDSPDSTWLQLVIRSHRVKTGWAISRDFTCSYWNNWNLIRVIIPAIVVSYLDSRIRLTQVDRALRCDSWSSHGIWMNFVYDLKTYQSIRYIKIIAFLVETWKHNSTLSDSCSVSSSLILCCDFWRLSDLICAADNCFGSSRDSFAALSMLLSTLEANLLRFNIWNDNKRCFDQCPLSLTCFLDANKRLYQR